MSFSFYLVTMILFFSTNFFCSSSLWISSDHQTFIYFPYCFLSKIRLSFVFYSFSLNSSLYSTPIYILLSLSYPLKMSICISLFLPTTYPNIYSESGYEHGTKIRWLLRTCCARKLKNRVSGEIIHICDCSPSIQMPWTS